MTELINANPTIYNPTIERIDSSLEFDDEDERDVISSNEIYSYVRHLLDPEHPLTLEQLHVVCKEHIVVNDEDNYILVQFTPTIPHCSMATLIGMYVFPLSLFFMNLDLDLANMTILKFEF